MIRTQHDKIHDLFVDYSYYANGYEDFDKFVPPDMDEFKNRWRAIMGWNKEKLLEKAIKVYTTGPDHVSSVNFSNWLVLNTRTERTFSVHVTLYNNTSTHRCEPEVLFTSKESAIVYVGTLKEKYKKEKFVRIASVVVYDLDILDSPRNIVLNTQIKVK